MKAAGKPVTMGSKALRNTWRPSTWRSLRPLALAVTTYCLRISSRKAFFVSMAVTAKLPATMAVTGKVMCQR